MSRAVNPGGVLDVKPSRRYRGSMKARLMNGAGNKFVLADARGHADMLGLSRKTVHSWAHDLHFDQLLVLEASDSADAFMRIWNADGDEVAACGNGTRAAAWFLMEESGGNSVTIGTAGGLLHAARAGVLTVSVDMGPPRLDWQDIPLARDMDTVALDYVAEAGGVRVERPGAVSMGNPHAVFFVRDVEALPIARLGPEVELDPLFPERVNAGFAQIYDPTHIRLRVWERGAGITAACGTGACAALVAAHRRGLAERQASIMADGGELFVEWRLSDDHVILTGPVEDEGEVELDLRA
jgi:diaminopimelate epimerase